MQIMNLKPSRKNFFAVLYPVMTNNLGLNIPNFYFEAIAAALDQKKRNHMEAEKEEIAENT